jgi:hypothetical protein
MANLAGIVQQLKVERESGSERSSAAERSSDGALQWDGIQKTDRNSGQDVSGRKSKNRGCSKSEMEESSDKSREEAKWSRRTKANIFAGGSSAYG